MESSPLLETPLPRRKFVYSALKEPFCAVSHYTGAVLSFIALITLLIAAHGRLWQTLGGAVFGLSLITSLVVITLIWNRLAQHKVGAAGMVPTLWIVLGPVGQSITAVNLLASNAPAVVDASTAHALLVVALVYGFAMLGFALLWTVIALAITIRTAREHLLFSLTWWSFTFPVGTCVTGLNGLALHSGLTVVAVLATAHSHDARQQRNSRNQIALRHDFVLSSPTRRFDTQRLRHARAARSCAPVVKEILKIAR